MSDNRPWTAAELQTVEAMRGRHTQREIAETLGRSTVSVKNKMKAARLHTGTKATTPANTASVSLAERLGVQGREGTASQPTDITTRSLRRSALRENNTLEPILIVSDAHRPYHSKVWWDLLMQVGRFLQPKHLIVIGDFADFYAVSSHDKDPQRATRLEEELADVDQGLDDLDSLGASNKLFIEGNHEDRLRRLLMQTPSLAGLVSTEKLLKLKERGWHFTPYKRHTALGALHYTHDVGASGRNAAFRVLDTYQHSAVSGHAHRMQYIVEGNATGEVKLSAMFGWGGDVNAVDYMHIAKARKDWCLGFGTGYYDPASGYSYLVPVPVVDATVCVNGRLFRSAA